MTFDQPPVFLPASPTPVGGAIEFPLPAALDRVGPAGRFCWEEFFSGQLRNKHTRTAYLHAVSRFLAWVDPIEPDLARITPGLVGRYFDALPLAIPSKKLHLSAIRRFFDLLVQRHVVILNPAYSVRQERYSVTEGKTPEITTEQARQLLQSIAPKAPIDFRDKAIIATLIYTAARAGAVARLRIGDLLDEGTQYSLRFNEKGNQQRSIPVRHDLETFLTDYLSLLDAGRPPKEAPFFRTISRQGTLTATPLSGGDICRLVKRRLAAAGLPVILSPHSFRSCTATDLLESGVSLADVQYLLGHADVRVTRLYDRRQRRITRNIVERISV